MEEAKRSRRRHSAEFKQQVLAECTQPVASVAAVALARGLTDNLVRKWRRQARVGDLAQGDGDTFIPVTLSSAAPATAVFAGGHRRRSAARHGQRADPLAGLGGRRVRRLAAGPAGVIRVDAVWLAVEPVDLRLGPESALARTVRVLGQYSAASGCLSVRSVNKFIAACTARLHRCLEMLLAIQFKSVLDRRDVAPAACLDRTRCPAPIRTRGSGVRRSPRADAVTRGLFIRVSPPQMKRGRASRLQALEFDGSPSPAWTRTRDLRISQWNP